MKKILQTFIYIELLLAVISFVITLNFSNYEANLGLVLNNSLKFIPLALNLLMIILFIIELRFCGKKRVGRLILTFVLALMLVFLSINKKIDLFNTILMIIDLIYCVLLLIEIIRLDKKKMRKHLSFPSDILVKNHFLSLILN